MLISSFGRKELYPFLFVAELLKWLVIGGADREKMRCILEEECMRELKEINTGSPGYLPERLSVDRRFTVFLMPEMIFEILDSVPPSDDEDEFLEMERKTREAIVGPEMDSDGGM
jgi:hypothetical protein